MSLFEWNERFSVHIGEVDNQHRKLMEILNRLFDAMKAGKGRGVLDNVLRDLMDYTVYHFGTEERLMSEFNYHAYPMHKNEHIAFTKRVFEFEREFSAGRLSLSLELFDFLKEWLVEHIAKSDMSLGGYLQTKGLS
jgi:hemerythrin